MQSGKAGGLSDYPLDMRKKAQVVYMGLEGFLEPWAANVHWLLGEDLCCTRKGVKEGLLCHSSNGF